jgi:hypothetical protein
LKVARHRYASAKPPTAAAKANSRSASASKGKKTLQLLRNYPQIRSAFICEIALPNANKQFDCKMFS